MTTDVSLDLQSIIRVLATGPSTVESLIAGAPVEALAWRESPGTWTCEQVLAHLAEGEITDWMPRVERILADGGSFAPFDREAGFARYRGRRAMSLVGEFGQLRRANLDRLSRMALEPADLEKTGVHPEFGRVTLGELLACWATHDLAHVAQISRVLTRALGAHVGPWRKYFSLLGGGPTP